MKEDIERLQEIKDEMLTLLQEAHRVIRQASVEKPIIYDRACSYWLGHLEECLDASNRYNTDINCTIRELQALCDGADDDVESEDDE